MNELAHEHRQVGRRSRRRPGLAVELEAVSRSFREGNREHVVLEAADLEVRPGEIVVLLGRSGSGKSTVLNLIGGIDSPDAGTVRVAGRDLGALAERERTLFRRRHIGFVFQAFHLLPTLTVIENVLLPIELRQRLAPADHDRARELLERVGLAGRERSFPDVLSGGEQQRVGVARALAHDPELLLADEPTGNLDLETGLEVLELLDHLTRRAGKTMVMVTHSRQVVGLADRVFGIESGRLVERTNAAGVGS